jgi:hypothetical protein
MENNESGCSRRPASGTQTQYWMQVKLLVDHPPHKLRARTPSSLDESSHDGHLYMYRPSVLLIRARSTAGLPPLS